MRKELNERKWPAGSQMELAMQSAMRADALLVAVDQMVGSPFPAVRVTYTWLAHTSGPSMPLNPGFLVWTTLN